MCLCLFVSVFVFQFLLLPLLTIIYDDRVTNNGEEGLLGDRGMKNNRYNQKTASSCKAFLSEDFNQTLRKLYVQKCNHYGNFTNMNKNK